MFNLNAFSTRTAGLVALIMSASSLAPLFTPQRVAAQPFRLQANSNYTSITSQLFRRSTSTPSYPSYPSTPSYSNTVVIARGTNIPVYYDEAEKILVAQDETMDITLKVAANIRNRSGQILIPYGSDIFGQIQPVGDGSRFVAQSIMIQGRQTPFSATSDIITRTEVIKEGANTRDILYGVAAGAAAATIIAAITGDGAIATEEVLGGAGVGALGGWIFGEGSAELISIDPNTDLGLTLESDLVLN